MSAAAARRRRRTALCRASRVRRVERVELCCSTSSTQPKCMGSTRRTCRVVSSRVESSQVEFGLKSHNITSRIQYLLPSNSSTVLICCYENTANLNLGFCGCSIFWQGVIFGPPDSYNAPCNIVGCTLSRRIIAKRQRLRARRRTGKMVAKIIIIIIVMKVSVVLHNSLPALTAQTDYLYRIVYLSFKLPRQSVY